MAIKKDSKNSKAKASTTTEEIEQIGKISSTVDLKNYLQAVLDKLKEDSAPAIYVASAMNYVFNLPNVYDFLDNQNRELARDIWLRVKQSGFQVKNPPLLFDEVDGQAGKL